MSPLLITALIIGGIALLIAIGYINHVVENSKLEKARLKAELTTGSGAARRFPRAFPASSSARR